MTIRERAEQVWHNANKAFHAGDTFVGGGRTDVAITSIESALRDVIEECAIKLIVLATNADDEKAEALYYAAAALRGLKG